MTSSRTRDCFGVASRHKRATRRTERQAQSHQTQERFDRRGGSSVSRSSATAGSTLRSGWAPAYSLTVNDVIDYFATLPIYFKALAALRYYDELPLKKIVRPMNVSQSSINRGLALLRTHLVEFTWNQFIDDPWQLEPMSSPVWVTIPLSLTKHVRSAHGCDVEEYVRRFVQAMRDDVWYLTGVVRSQRFEVAGQRISLTSEQQAVVENMYAAGISKAAIARASASARRACIRRSPGAPWSTTPILRSGSNSPGEDGTESAASPQEVRSISGNRMATLVGNRP